MLQLLGLTSGIFGGERTILVTDLRKAVERAEDTCIQRPENNDVEEWM